MVIHNISPSLLTVSMLPSGSITEEQYDDAFGRSVKGVLFRVQKELPLLVPARQICGGTRFFEIEMDESHRCRIVYVKAAGF
jgi:hypothetical protein